MVIGDMTANLPFRIFLVCLVCCATLALGIIWHADDHALPPVYFQTTATLFVIGLANFLIWFSYTLRALHALLRRT